MRGKSLLERFAWFWRECLRIELSRPDLSGHTGFEDQESHQAPSTPMPVPVVYASAWRLSRSAIGPISIATRRWGEEGWGDRIQRASSIRISMMAVKVERVTCRQCDMGIGRHPTRRGDWERGGQGDRTNPNSAFGGRVCEAARGVLPASRPCSPLRPSGRPRRSLGRTGNRNTC